jgi:hypothetical protein
VVAAAMVGIGADTNMDRCMNAAHTLFVTGSSTLHDEADYAQTPYVVSPAEVSASALATAMAKLVLSRGYGTKLAPIGLINYDIPEYDRAADNEIKPLLSAAGVKLTQYKIAAPASTPDIANSVTILESAELKLKAEGIKTVMFLCAGCYSLFAQAASQQGYYPRYILSSMDGPEGLSGSSYAKDLGTSVVLGYQPAFDQNSYAQPKTMAFNPTFNLCRKIELASGQVTSAVALATSLDVCEDVMDIYAAAQANPTEDITSASLLQGLLSLGKTHLSGMSFATDLTPSRHAGAASFRTMTWSSGCACLAYSGSIQPFGA